MFRLYKGVHIYRGRGFTLTEVVIVTGLVALMTSIIFYNAPEFNRRTVLTRAARETGSFLRDAETRAIAIHSANCAAPPCFPKRYGVSFQSLTTPDPARNNIPRNEEIFLFVDRALGGVPPNSAFAYSATCGDILDECVARLEFLNGVHIQNILSPGLPVPDFTALEVQTLDVIYEYPNPKVIISSVDSGSAIEFPDSLLGPYRILIAPAGFTSRCYDAGTGAKDVNCREVQAWTTGQVALIE